jgi:undecaprenyl-diphosphatase
MRATTLRHPIVASRRARIMPPWVRRLDQSVSRRVNASASWGGHDRGYSRLSHTADRSLLWYAFAVSLVVLGQRRAALRGVGSMVTAALVSDVMVKRLFAGPRPLFSAVPAPRRLRRYPTTTSFPSGHSASAAAFATGVALESAAAGLVVAPVAAAVAYSRIHVGAHWLSDVVGGVGIGVAVALLGRIIVPGRGARGRQGRMLARSSH